jgi:hypothetical protein
MLVKRGEPEELNMASTTTSSIRTDFYRVAGWAGAINLREELTLAAKNGQTDKVNDLIAVGANVTCEVILQSRKRRPQDIPTRFWR